jgi:hypothetical protein
MQLNMLNRTRPESFGATQTGNLEVITPKATHCVQPNRSRVEIYVPQTSTRMRARWRDRQARLE